MKMMEDHRPGSDIATSSAEGVYPLQNQNVNVNKMIQSKEGGYINFICTILYMHNFGQNESAEGETLRLHYIKFEKGQQY